MKGSISVPGAATVSFERDLQAVSSSATDSMGKMVRRSVGFMNMIAKMLVLQGLARVDADAMSRRATSVGLDVHGGHKSGFERIGVDAKQNVCVFRILATNNCKM